MDGIHDLGGRQGFGAIDVDEPDEIFHAPWEGRMWGIARSFGRPGWTIDWWRHGRELIDPADYLTRPYFDQWMQTYAALMVDSGIATVEEIATGKSKTAPAAAEKPMAPEDIAAVKLIATHYDRDLDTAPAFKVGDAVRTKSQGTTGHTRLPGYARSHIGVIYASHGGHEFADASARGEDRAEPLYTVAFEASELWPEVEGSKDKVFIDLWESYLEPL